MEQEEQEEEAEEADEEAGQAHATERTAAAASGQEDGSNGSGSDEDASDDGEDGEQPAPSVHAAAATAAAAAAEAVASAAAAAAAAGEAISHASLDSELETLHKRINPILSRFGMSRLLLLQLQQHVKDTGATPRRGKLTLLKLLEQIAVNCDPRLCPEQYLEGMLSCYMATAWVLRVNRLPLSWREEDGLGPDVNVKAASPSVPVSMCGDMFHYVKLRQPARFALMARSSQVAPTRGLLMRCPWLSLTPPGGDALSNLVTLELPKLRDINSLPARLALQTQVLHKIDEAIDKHVTSSTSSSSSSSAIVTPAGLAKLAVQFFLTSPRRTDKPVSRSSSSSSSSSSISLDSQVVHPARLRYALQHGCPVGLPTLRILTKLPQQQLHGLLSDAGSPFWLHPVPAASLAAARAVDSNPVPSSRGCCFLFNLPLLVARDRRLQQLLASDLSLGEMGFATHSSALLDAVKRADSVQDSVQESMQDDSMQSSAEEDDDQASELPPAAKPRPTWQQKAATSLPPSAAFKGSPAAAERLHRAALAAAVAGPLHEEKRGPLPGLDYTTPLPGLGPVQVVVVSSAESADYSSMLQHLSQVSLVGLDTELAWEFGVVIVTIMAPAVPPSASDPGWPDTVYVVDLLPTSQASSDSGPRSSSRRSGSSTTAISSSSSNNAGGSSSNSDGSSSNSRVPSDLVAGLAAVLEDPGLTLVVQDARMEVARLSTPPFNMTCGSVIDTQMCFLLLEATRAQTGQIAPSQMLRRRLDVLLSCYGLSHPNKMAVVEMCQTQPGMWLSAPRPLSPLLLSYVVDDVRYLPALVLLMERDLLRLAPGALIRELQPKLPKALQVAGSRVAFSQQMLLPNVTARLQHMQSQQAGRFSTGGGGSLFAPAAGVDAAALPPASPSSSHEASSSGTGHASSASSSPSSSSSAGSSSSSSSNWLEPSLSDPAVSRLLFKVNCPAGPGASPQQQQQQQKQQQDQQQRRQLQGTSRYELLVPSGAISLAQRAAAAAAAATAGSAPNAAAAAAAGTNKKQRQQQQQQQQLRRPAASSNAEWAPDQAAQSLLGLLPSRLASQLKKEMLAAVKQLMEQCRQQQQPIAPLLQLQLSSLLVLPGEVVRFKLTMTFDARAAAGASSSSSRLRGLRRQFQLQPPKGTAPKIDGLLRECVASLKQHQVAAAVNDPAGGNTMFDDEGCCFPAGTLHKIVPVSQSSSSSSSSGDSSSKGKGSSNNSVWAALHYFVGRDQPGISAVIGDVLADIRGRSSERGSSSSSNYSVAASAAAARSAVGPEWSFGLAPVAPAPEQAGGSTRGRLVLLLGPPRSGKSSLVRDAAAVLSNAWQHDVALIDWRGRTAGPGLTANQAGKSSIGSALQLQVADVAAQSAAVAAAWQHHACHVLLLEQLLQGQQVVAEVAAALGAGVSVVAVADGASCLQELQLLAASAAKQADDAGAGAAGAAHSHQQQQQQQQQSAAAALLQLLVRLSSAGDGGSCTLVECLPSHRWRVHSSLVQSLQLQVEGLQPPVQTRQCLSPDAAASVAGVIDDEGRLQLLADSAGPLMVTVAGFATYAAAAAALPPAQLLAVRALLYPPSQ